MDYQPWGLIHHSDKGSQYSSKVYTALLEKNQIHISMGRLHGKIPMRNASMESLKMNISKDG
jgi:putative transposase